MFEDDGTYGAIYECTGRRPKCTKGHFKQHDLFMYHISREWNCLPSNKLYTLGRNNIERSVVSSMFQNYNLLQSGFSFSTLLFSLLPLNLMLGTLILLEDYQIQILKNLWCTISWGDSILHTYVLSCIIVLKILLKAIESMFLKR